MIKFFKDNYIKNEENLQSNFCIFLFILIFNKGLCKRICENYIKNQSVKKAESAKLINLVIENKEKIMKSTFLENFKGRVKIENVLRKYVRGYSKDRIRKKKIEELIEKEILGNCKTVKKSKAEIENFVQRNYNEAEKRRIKFQKKIRKKIKKKICKEINRKIK